jgi:hypothetical protein
MPGSAKLRWRPSRGARRALGWVPLKAEQLKRKGKSLRFSGKAFRVFERELLLFVCALGIASAQRLRARAMVVCNPTGRPPDERHRPRTSLRHRGALQNARQPYRLEVLRESAPRCPRGIRLPVRLGVLRRGSRAAPPPPRAADGPRRDRLHIQREPKSMQRVEVRARASQYRQFGRPTNESRFRLDLPGR